MGNTITKEHVARIIESALVSVESAGEKTTVVTLIMPNGFEITESSSCVDPANYDASIGRDICMKRITDKIWELEGYRLQCSLAGDEPLDFKDRVRNEKRALEEKVCKLESFIADAARFNDLPGDERARLTNQQYHMTEYLNVLSDRIAAFAD